MPVENSETTTGGSASGQMLQWAGGCRFEIHRRRIFKWPRLRNPEPRFGRPRPPIMRSLKRCRNDLLYEVVDSQVRELPPMGIIGVVRAESAGEETPA